MRGEQAVPADKSQDFAYQRDCLGFITARGQVALGEVERKGVEFPGEPRLTAVVVRTDNPERHQCFLALRPVAASTETHGEAEEAYEEARGLVRQEILQRNRTDHGGLLRS